MRSSLYIAKGSSVFSPILKAVVGATGLIRRSYCCSALFSACWTSVRTCERTAGQVIGGWTDRLVKVQKAGPRQREKITR